MGTFNLGAFVSGAGTGYRFVQDAADQADDSKWKRTVRAREQKKYDQQDAVEAAQQKAMQDSAREADRQNALPAQSSGGVVPASNVAGAGVTTDPAYASRLADEQSFISGGDVKPEAGYAAPGVGFSKNYGDAQSLAASQGVTNAPRPQVSKDDLYWKKYAKDVEAAHLQNNDLAGAEKIRQLSESRQLQQYGKKWMAANMAVRNGDYEGSLPLLEDLYNNDFKDGGFVKVTKGDGGAFTVTKYNVDGQPVEARSASAEQIASGAVNALEPAKYIELEIKSAAEERSAARTEHRDDKKYAQQIALQGAKDTASSDRQESKFDAQAMLADKRFAAMLQVADARSRRGELGGKQPTDVATAEWLKGKGIAKTDTEAWKMATQLGEQVNEKVSSDQFGNVTIHDPKSGEITRVDTEGKKSVIRPAKGVVKPTIQTLPPGAKQIGTSGGKPVYQDKDGKKFMQN